MTSFKLSSEELKQLDNLVSQAGYISKSAYIRDAALGRVDTNKLLKFHEKNYRVAR